MLKLPLSCYYSPYLLFDILIRSKPIAVQISSLTRTIRATKIPALVVKPNPDIDIRNPPSRPPSCKGIKNKIFANNVVKEIIRIQFK